MGDALFTAYCRLCLERDCTNMCIIPQQSEAFGNVVHWFIDATISPEDRLSTTVCDKCEEFVNHVLKFKTACLRKQKILPNWTREKQNPAPNISLNESIQIKDEPMSDNEEPVNTPHLITPDNVPPLLSPMVPLLNGFRDSGQGKTPSRTSLNNNENSPRPPALPRGQPDARNESEQAAPTNLTIQITDGKVECQVCFKPFTTIQTARRHQARLHSIARHKQTFSCGDCNMSFASVAELNSHTQTAHNPTAYTCGDCGKKCRSQREMDAHRATHLKLSLTRDPSTKTYRTSRSCAHCSQAFDEESQLAEHMRAVHGDNVPPTLKATNGSDHPEDVKTRCNYCQRVFSSVHGMRVHMHMMHLSLRCATCQMWCTGKSDLLRHMKSHDGSRGKARSLGSVTQSHYCKLCCVTLADDDAWNDHLASHRLPAPAASQSSDEASSNSSEETDYFTCPKCYKNLTTKAQLRKHLEQSHKISSTSQSKGKPAGKKHRCNICDKECDSQDDYAKHQLTHIAKLSKSTFCKYCKVSLGSELALAEHMWTEHEENMEAAPPILDNMTDDNESSMAGGKQNISKHIADSKVVVTKTTKRKYKSMIETRHPHECTTCGKTFPKWEGLRIHESWHKRTDYQRKSGKPTAAGGEIEAAPSTLELNGKSLFQRKTYVCVTCHDLFPTAELLKQHSVMVHGKALRAPQEDCTQCDETFASIAELHAHIKEMHKKDTSTSGVVPPGSLVCPYCEKEFVKSCGLASHMRSHKRRGEELKEPEAKRRKIHHTTPTPLPPKPNKEPLSPPAKDTEVPYKCCICKAQFEQLPDLRKHVIGSHPF